MAISKKSWEISPIEWGETPDIEAWKKAAIEARNAEAEAIKAGFNAARRVRVKGAEPLRINTSPADFFIANRDSTCHWEKINGRLVSDIGSYKNVLEISLADGTGKLKIEMCDVMAHFVPVSPLPDLSPIDYHQMGVWETLRGIDTVDTTMHETPVITIKTDRSEYAYAVPMHTRILTYTFNVLFEGKKNA